MIMSESNALAHALTVLVIVTETIVQRGLKHASRRGHGIGLTSSRQWQLLQMLRHVFSICTREFHYPLVLLDNNHAAEMTAGPIARHNAAQGPQ